eukprot:1914140-Amphidinium_carterae.1
MLDLSKRKLEKTASAPHTEKQQTFNKRRLLYKLVWMQNEHNIPTENIWNLDGLGRAKLQGRWLRLTV